MGFFDKIKDAKQQHDAKAEEERRRAREARERSQREKEEQEQRIRDGLRNSALMKYIVAGLINEPWLPESQGSWDSNRRQIIVTPEAVSANDYAEDDYFHVLKEISPGANNTVSISRAIDRMAQRDSRSYGGWESISVPFDIGRQFTDLLDKKYQDRNAVYITYEGAGYEKIGDSETLLYFAEALKAEFEVRYPNCTFSRLVHKNYYGLRAFEMYVPEKKKNALSVDNFR